MFGHGESKLNQTTQILLMLFARTCHIVPKSRSTSGVNRKKEPSFQLRQRCFQIIAEGLRQILCTIIFTTTTPQKLFPRYHHAWRMMTHDPFCNAMILETIFATDKKWWDEGDAGHRAARLKITWYLMVFAQHFPQNHQSLLSSMPKKIFNSSESKKILRKKKKKKLTQPQIQIVYTFAHLHLIYSKKKM